MGFHTFDADRAEELEDETRFRFCSREELLEGLETGGRLLDVGSGTGFYTDELAPFFERVYAADIQRAMAERHREHGLPGNVSLLTCDAGRLPLADGSVDACVSTMVFHESPDATAAELARVLDSGGRLVVVDWSSAGRGESGPPRDQRYGAADARERLSTAGFRVERAAERGETFRVVARTPS